MSIHVCECDNHGRTEFHLRYPGMTEREAQATADRINGGFASAPPPPASEPAPKADVVDSEAWLDEAMRLFDLAFAYQGTFRANQLRNQLRTHLALALATHPAAPAVAEPVRLPPFEGFEGKDKNQPGYHWAKGWNDALRRVMDYNPAAPAQPAREPSQPLTDEQVVNEFSRPCYQSEDLFDWFDAGVRFAERRHGITPKEGT